MIYFDKLLEPQSISVLVTSTAAGYDPWNAIDVAHPKLAWLGQHSTLDCGLQLDLGASYGIRGIFVDDINVATLKLAYSTDGVTYTTLLRSIATDTRSLTRRWMEDFGSAGVSARYVRVQAGASTIDGQPIRIGTIAVATGRTEIVYHGRTLQYVSDAEVTIGLYRTRRSHVGLRFEVDTGIIPASGANAWHQLGRADTKPVIIYFPSSSQSQAYAVWVLSYPTVQQLSTGLASVRDIVLREVR